MRQVHIHISRTVAKVCSASACLRDPDLKVLEGRETALSWANRHISHLMSGSSICSAAY